MTIGVSSRVTDLKGEGSEYLISSNGEVLAEFYNGMLVGSFDLNGVNPNEVTKS